MKQTKKQTKLSFARSQDSVKIQESSKVNIL